MNNDSLRANATKSQKEVTKDIADLKQKHQDKIEYYDFQLTFFNNKKDKQEIYRKLQKTKQDVEAIFERELANLKKLRQQENATNNKWTYGH